MTQLSSHISIKTLNQRGLHNISERMISILRSPYSSLINPHQIGLVS
jgi:hypothetical protein